MILMMAITAPILILLGVPIWVILASISILCLVFFIELPLSIIAQTMFGSLNEFVLLAVPLFILAGHLMGTGSIALRLINWAKACIGNLPGGMAITTVGVNEMFGAISGSAPATTATLGKILFPALQSEGYNARFSAGLLASMGALSTIVPPSINMILYSATANVSVAQVFLGGIIPSILIAGLIGGFCYYYGRRYDPRPSDSAVLVGRPPLFSEAPWKRLAIMMTETKSAVIASGVPIIIFGGIYSGLATPTEVAALACVYSLFASVIIYQELEFKELVGAFKQSALVSAQIFIIMAAAGLFAWVLAIAQVPQNLVEFIQGLGVSWWLVLLMINVMLLIVGMFMDPVSAIVILTPLLKPLAMSMGIDPIHFGIIMVVNLAIGMFTPPFGLNLFVVMSVCKVPMTQIVRGLIPFLLLYLTALGLVSYLPMLSLWIPTVVYR